LESFELQVSMLNNQVDTLLKKLNHLEQYLSQQSELRQIAENRLQEVLYRIIFVNNLLVYINILLF